MWRINWIHPFSGGNGRTSRAVSYLALCAKLGYRLPGANTIPDQIVANRKPYYAALDVADSAYSQGKNDVSAMEELLSNLLAIQLSEVLRAARTM
jgi:Fic family protein